MINLTEIKNRLSSAKHYDSANLTFGLSDVEEIIRLIESIDAKPKDSVAQRITEQDAREIAWSASFRTGEKYGQTLYDAINKWWESEGRTLIAKLNENREPEVKASVEPIAYYYTRDRYTPQLREAHRRIPEPDRSLWSEVELVPVTANKAEVPNYADAVKILEKAEREGNHIKCLFMIGEALDLLPPLKDGAQ